MQQPHLKEKIRIIIADDHDVLRESWKFFLERDDRFTVIGLCRNGLEAIKQAQALTPDIILMDINMSVANGFEATRKILELIPSAKIIGVSVNTHPGYAVKMLELGARGFVTKNSPFSELIAAIVKVHQGDEYVCDEISNNSSHTRID
jgi:DNA-binding NarL/FixJ family response regulator